MNKEEITLEIINKQKQIKSNDTAIKLIQNSIDLAKEELNKYVLKLNNLINKKKIKNIITFGYYYSSKRKERLSYNFHYYDDQIKYLEKSLRELTETNKKLNNDVLYLNVLYFED